PPPPPSSTLFPYTTLFRSAILVQGAIATVFIVASLVGATVKNAYLVLTQTTLILFFIPYVYLFAAYLRLRRGRTLWTALVGVAGDRKSTRLNSSHVSISYA